MKPYLHVKAMRYRSQTRSMCLTGAGLWLLLFSAFPVSVAAHVGMHEEIEAVSIRIDANPGDAALWQQRGELRRMHEEWELSRSDLMRARKLDPTLPGIDLSEARLDVDIEDYRASLPLLNRFLAREPQSVRGLITRAQARRGLGQNLQAAEDYRLAIEAFTPPRSPAPDFYIERARALAAAGHEHIDTAVQCLEEGSVRLGPLISLQHEALQIERSAGRLDAVLARLDRIAALTPHDASWLVLRAEVLLETGRTAEARRTYAVALQVIDTLPAHKRTTRTVQRMRAQIEAALRE